VREGHFTRRCTNDQHHRTNGRRPPPGIVPIGASALRSSELVKNATLKV